MGPRDSPARRHFRPDPGVQPDLRSSTPVYKQDPRFHPPRNPAVLTAHHAVQRVFGQAQGNEVIMDMLRLGLPNSKKDFRILFGNS
jgi:hypothetical protein